MVKKNRVCPSRRSPLLAQSAEDDALSGHAKADTGIKAGRKKGAEGSAKFVLLDMSSRRWTSMLQALSHFPTADLSSNAVQLRPIEVCHDDESLIAH